ncbi:MAG: SgcJ/EcaC family oxidoreductase [Vulcanimicrobiaceae bacterium]
MDAIVAGLTEAWNAGDGERFAAVFAEDGEQVNIFGAALVGRAEIRDRHVRIFTTIFRESTNTLHVVRLRYAAADIALARVASIVEVPHGPLQGELRTLVSLVLRRVDVSWEIVLFHNTRVTSASAPP